MVTLIKWWNDLIKGTQDAPTQRQCFIRLGSHHSENSCHCSVTQSCLTLCDPMDCSTPSFPVHHQLPYSLKLAQTHVHWIGDAIQPSHPLPSPSPPALNLSQYQAWSFQMRQFFLFFFLFHHMATVLELQLQHQQYSGLISFRIDWFDFIAVQATLRSRLQHHSSKVINSSVLCLVYCPTLTSIRNYQKKHSFDYTDLCWQSKVSAF